jgi:hypothetical protein
MPRDERAAGWVDETISGEEGGGYDPVGSGPMRLVGGALRMM